MLGIMHADQSVARILLIHRAGLHGQAKLGHQELGGHGVLSDEWP